MTQRVTVLRTLGPVLAKTWAADGSIKSYDNAAQFRARVIEVADIEAWHNELERLQRDERSCVIRGAPAETTDLTKPVRRRLGVFEDAPSHLFLVDVDGYSPILADPIADPVAAIDEYIEECLPPFFDSASFVWQLSGSHGHPSKAGMLRAHLWFWLAEPLTCEQAEAWAAKYIPSADHTVHRTVQVNYTARPVMQGGQVDPVVQRCGHYPVRSTGARTCVFDDGMLRLPDDMPVPDVSETRRVTREDRRALVDPREKPGVVGALCRAFEPEQIVTLWPDHFAAGKTPERITWLHGGGTPEGVRVTDSGTHLYSSHATAPVQRACNLFDFIRVHVFGHLDDGSDPDALALDITAAPSYQATQAWALALPEVQAELDSPKAEAAVEAAADAKAEVLLSVADERAQRVANIKALIERADTLDALEHDIARRVAKSKSFSDSDRELIAVALQRRSATLMDSRGLRIQAVRKWLTPVLGDDVLASTFPHLTAEGTPKLTIENVAALCARLGVTVRYNVITKDIDVLGTGVSFTPDNRANNCLAWLQGQATIVNMPNSTGLFKSFLHAMADANQYNPVAEWIESRAWDGRSRLQDLADTLVTPPGEDPALKLMLLRKWLVQCVAVAMSPDPIQARGVLTLQGKQYGGKTRWLKSLVPGHEYLAMAGRQVDPHSRDSVMVVIQHWLVELGELDATFKRSDIASLKSFIAQDVDMFRIAYAARESKFQRRTSMFASVNDPEFLADPTGNTRFWVVPVESVRHEHGIDMQQVWAEVLHLWREGEPHWLSAEEMERVNTASEQFEAVDPLFESIAVAFDWKGARVAEKAGTRFEGKWERFTATQVLKHVGASSSNRSDTKRASDALRRLGARKAPRCGAEGTRGWYVPVAEDFAGVD